MHQTAFDINYWNLNNSNILLQELDLNPHRGPTYRWYEGTKVHFRLQLAEWYALGVTGDFNYAKAIEHLKQITNLPCDKKDKNLFSDAVLESFGHLIFDLDTYAQKREIWNDEAIVRLSILQTCKIDQLLNHLRLEMKQYTPLIGVFEFIETAAYTLLSGRDNLQQDCSSFKEQIVDIIKQFYHDNPAFVQNNDYTRIIKLMSVIVSICTFGGLNYATGRSIYGLFSSRIEADIKLKELVQVSCS